MTAAPLGVSPEVLAERLLRKAWNEATKPDLNAIADECALTRREVEAIRDRLVAARSDSYRAPGRVQPPQTLDRPRVAPAPSPQGQNADLRPVETTPAWRAAADHPSAKVRRAVAKAVSAVDAVEQLLAAEAGKDELRRKEARLAAQLAAVRAEIRGKPTSERAKVACPDCGDVVGNLGVHRQRSAKHKGGDQ